MPSFLFFIFFFCGWIALIHFAATPFLFLLLETEFYVFDIQGIIYDFAFDNSLRMNNYLIKKAGVIIILNVEKFILFITGIYRCSS